MNKRNEEKALHYLRYLRERKGYTFYRLEQVTGVSRNTISRIEKGKQRPTLETLKKLAPAYGVDVDKICANVETFTYSEFMKENKEKEEKED